MVGELRARHVIHLHRLLREVATHCTEEHDMPEKRLEEYEDIDVIATDFKATKPEHEAAVMELADAVGDWADTQLDDVEAPDRERTPPLRA